VTKVFGNDSSQLSTDSVKISFDAPDSSKSYTRINLNGSKTLFEEDFKYDAAGNWIENNIYEITIKKGKKKRKPDRQFIRKIVYQ
jgi:hypothetical protein